MEQNLLNNIEKLYRNHIITCVITVALIIAVILVTIGVLKFKLIATKSGRIIFAILVIMGSILLLVLQFNSFYLIHKDYKESSYIILENTEVVITESSSFNSGIDYTNPVIVVSNGIEYELKMQTDRALSTGRKYNGTIAYLKHSKYLIWYDLD